MLSPVMTRVVYLAGVLALAIPIAANGQNAYILALSHGVVLDELGVQAEQRNAIERLAAEIAEEMQAANRRLIDESRAKADEAVSELALQSQIDKRMDEIKKERMKARHEFAAAQFARLEEVLDERQVDRLREITVQWCSGDLHFFLPENDEIARMIGVTQEQIDGIVAIRDRPGSVTDALHPARPSLQAFIEGWAELSKKVRNLLTPEQRSKLDELRGEPFDVASLPPYRPYTSMFLGVMGIRKISPVSLNLAAAGIVDEDLAVLSEWNRVKSLDLTGSQVTDAGLQHVAGLARLEELNLSHTKITDAGLPQLRGLTNLRELTVVGADVTEEGLDGLKEAVPELVTVTKQP